MCFLSIEMAAFIALYSFGRIAQHNVVLAWLPAGATGTTSAAVVAAQFRTTFPSTQYGLLAGVGGGAPNKKTNIRLGDVVVSKPAGRFGGVTGSLNKPPRVLLSALASLETKCHLQGSRLSTALLAIPVAYPELCSAATCTLCEQSRLTTRNPRISQDPIIHFGLIASANQVMRHGITRERLRDELDVLCFEMEAAGLMDNLPCLNKRWQPYAAATAAACAREILQFAPITSDEEKAGNGKETARKTAWLSASVGPFPNLRNNRFSGCEAKLALINT
ncbi:nucleoside phosphorylase domain-containing protein [Xylariaceae sp. FL0255]|nr:nucleoside phosphorylase domain-containing protein [Xylariaceae sp. FL0255]